MPASQRIRPTGLPPGLGAGPIGLFVALMAAPAMACPTWSQPRGNQISGRFNQAGGPCQYDWTANR